MLYNQIDKQATKESKPINPGSKTGVECYELVEGSKGIKVMIPKVVVLHNPGGDQEELELSAGARSRLNFLIQEYGSETAVVEAGLELLSKIQADTTYSAGAKARLKILTERLQGSERAVIELAIQYLLQSILNSVKERPPRFRIREDDFAYKLILDRIP
jgi:hypothetical protein